MTDPRSLAPGTTLAGRYTVEMALSAPDRGPVYRALDTHLQRRVTLRAFEAPTGWEAQDRARFEADIRKATPLDHAHLAGIRDFGADPALGLGFLLYEPLYGMALGMFLARREASSPVTALQILHDVAEGVGASHWAGLVHGEIHPGTIFMAYGEVDRQVRVELLTPGMPASRWLGSDAGDAARYAAPEVLRRESAPTPASDVYSLGVVAYELLVGLPGRWDESVTGTVPREAIEIPPANEIRPEIPHDIAEAIAGAIHHDPAQRFNDANTFALVLAHALDSSSMGPRMAAAFEGMPDFIRKDLPPTTAEAPGAPATPATPTASETLKPRPASPTASEAPEPRPASPATPTTRPPAKDADRPAPDTAAPVAASAATSDGRKRSPGMLAAAAVVALLLTGGVAWTLVRDPAPAAGARVAAAQVAVQPEEPEEPGEAANAEAAMEPTGPGDGDSAEPTGGAVPTGEDESDDAIASPTEPSGGEPDSRDVADEPLDIRAPAPLAVAAPRVEVPGARAEAAVLESLPALVDDGAGGPDASDESRVYGLAKVDEPPVLMNGDRLQRRLRRIATASAGPTEGRVLLEFLVLPEGRVDTATLAVLESSNRRLDAAAREVMALAEFDPGVIDGRPVRVLVQLELVLSADE